MAGKFRDGGNTVCYEINLIVILRGTVQRIKTCFNMTTATNKLYTFVESFKISRPQSFHL